MIAKQQTQQAITQETHPIGPTEVQKLVGASLDKGTPVAIIILAETTFAPLEALYMQGKNLGSRKPKSLESLLRRLATKLPRNSQNVDILAYLGRFFRSAPGKRGQIVEVDDIADLAQNGPDDPLAKASQAAFALLSPGVQEMLRMQQM